MNKRDQRKPDPRTPLFDVVAVNIETHDERIISSGLKRSAAEKIVILAVMRRGVDVEFFTVLPTGTKWADKGDA